MPVRSGIALRPTVTFADGGIVELQIDRFDPLTGWHFNRMLQVRVGGTATWTPPAEGRWRIRATVLGTRAASPSRSGYVEVVVQGH